MKREDIPNLWPPSFSPYPDHSVSKIWRILLAQGKHLERLTNGLLKGSLRFYRDSCGTIEFDIVAPKICEYRKTLIAVYYAIEDGFDFGQSRVVSHLTGFDKRLKNEADFETALREIFAHPETQRVVRVLFAQSELFAAEKKEEDE